MKLSKAEKTVIFATLFCVVVMCGVGYFRLQRVDAVSYTHLDVYKRQMQKMSYSRVHRRLGRKRKSTIFRPSSL